MYQRVERFHRFDLIVFMYCYFPSTYFVNHETNTNVNKEQSIAVVLNGNSCFSPSHPGKCINGARPNRGSPPAIRM